MYTHQKNILSAGRPISPESKVLVMVHGRGASAQSILELSNYLPVQEFALVAPQATQHSWYPYSFMAPAAQNQPALDSALEVLAEMVNSLVSQGVKTENIYLLGFSQGACLTSEFAARNAQRYGGLFLFTGGLIGQELEESNYQGDFGGTPIVITTGNPDPHVPVSRVEETTAILEKLGATVTQKIYPGRPHTILQEELELAKEILSQERS
ncbi:alpha/beta hydrolase [Rufibacter sp. LB8]|uniref:alpha/beta hydrolase n=1 Tax=Rufibacter sp. LB8 TaxID=2777781 RepID=UPI00178C580B|nr:dienelactone hydrolase family protein [Rufibacter sp. LB8]